MFFNAIKNFNKTYNKSIKALTCRHLISKSQNVSEDKEEATALDIEASFFNNSSVKYEPNKKSDLLRKEKENFKKESRTNIVSRPQQFPSFKKTRLERESESELIKDQNLGLEFLKLGRNDPRLSTLLTTVRSKKRRDKDGQIVIEGRRLILEALTCGLKLNTVIFSQKEQLADIKDNICRAQKQFNTKIYKTPHHDLKTWSTLITPPGVMAIFERPHIKSMDANTLTRSTPLPISVVCDNIREPNNLGSIIRSCAALPCLQVIVTHGCCDPWDSKALRAGCGGHFRLPIKDDINWENVPLMIPPEVVDNCCIFVAENNLKKLENKAPVVEYSKIGEMGSHNVVVIGGETHGVSDNAYRLMNAVGKNGKCIYIPLAEGIDSLNVASALTLILYEVRKNLLESKRD